MNRLVWRPKFTKASAPDLPPQRKSKLIPYGELKNPQCSGIFCLASEAAGEAPTIIARKNTKSVAKLVFAALRNKTFL